ncbi:MAG: polyphosphate kinase 1 [Myxococcota bacterium]
MAKEAQDAGAGCPELEFKGRGPYLNRELSWLAFNSRVLSLAEDPDRPLLERVKFLAISSRNLDEFFQVRVAGLKAQLEAGVGAVTPDGLAPSEQLSAIRAQTERFYDRQYEIYAKDLASALDEAGVRICTWDALSEEDLAWSARIFDEQIFPVLTPLTVDPAHPFQFISNLSLTLATVVRDARSHEHRFARVKVPPLFPRFLRLPSELRFVAIEDVISVHLPALFPGVEILSGVPFRVTRDADLAIEEDEADDLLSAIEHGLKRRLRESAGVRLEVAESMSMQVRNLLSAELELDTDDLYIVKGPLDLGGLWQLTDIDRPDLKDEPARVYTHPRLRAVQKEGEASDLFAVLREGPILVHHPYDSFETSVQAFLAAAASDPQVLAIKHTLYRTSGARSPILRNLARAAEAGKQVVALVELKARFDEEANIEWARTLEEAGVHVVYGQVGLKTHAKIALVVRQEADGIRRYCHVGTGNYNPVTARIYEDVGILSADPDLGRDLTHLFNHLTGYGREHAYRRLLVAPAQLRPALLRLIRREAEAQDGRIILKANSLADPEIIDALYAASQAGVRIDLIIRGICGVRPGVPGLSERIRVRSIVGRFLEHSRIFRFGSEARGRRYFLGSADLMQRNLNGRVEAVLEVDEPELQRQLDEILHVALGDDALAWELRPDGSWCRVPPSTGVNAHALLEKLAHGRAKEGSGVHDELSRA